MRANPEFQVGWRHPLWQYVRFYHTLGKKDKELFLEEQTNFLGNSVVSFEQLAQLKRYLVYRDEALSEALGLLRTEEEARAFCDANGLAVGVTQTQSADHHQSSKSLIAATSYIASNVAQAAFGLEADLDPQSRCGWNENGIVHVSARNLDGAIPGLESPSVIWEIKEYWGKTSGGSKMSDALYECLLVGTELRLFEEQTGRKVFHACILDGKQQWNSRKSDLVRFIDILNQGLLDVLIIGREVEYDWEPFLVQALQESGY